MNNCRYHFYWLYILNIFLILDIYFRPYDLIFLLYNFHLNNHNNKNIHNMDIRLLDNFDFHKFLLVNKKKNFYLCFSHLLIFYILQFFFSLNLFFH